MTMFNSIEAEMKCGNEHRLKPLLYVLIMYYSMSARLNTELICSYNTSFHFCDTAKWLNTSWLADLLTELKWWIMGLEAGFGKLDGN